MNSLNLILTLIAGGGVIGFIIAAVLSMKSWGKEKEERDEFERLLDAEKRLNQAQADRPRTDNDVIIRLRNAANRAD